MQVNANQEDGVSVLSLDGRMDSSTSPVVDQELSAAIGGGSPVLLDLSALEYISSAGLRVLLKAAKQAQSAKVHFAVCSAVPAVREIFDVSGFSTLLKMHESRGAGLAAIRQ
jgi:anti-anti-sigma factor